jgi:DNA-binding protein HU-beta
MTKSAMVEALAQRWGGISKRQAEENLNAWIALLTATVKREKALKIPDLGTFRLKQLKARTGRNPQTGAPLKIAARRKVSFTAAKTFKAVILGSK